MTGFRFFSIVIASEREKAKKKVMYAVPAWPRITVWIAFESTDIHFDANQHHKRTRSLGDFGVLTKEERVTDNTP